MIVLIIMVDQCLMFFMDILIVGIHMDAKLSIFTILWKCIDISH